jgi:hypothetical protein
VLIIHITALQIATYFKISGDGKAMTREEVKWRYHCFCYTNWQWALYTKQNYARYFIVSMRSVALHVLRLGTGQKSFCKKLALSIKKKCNWPRHDTRCTYAIKMVPRRVSSLLVLVQVTTARLLLQKTALLVFDTSCAILSLSSYRYYFAWDSTKCRKRLKIRLQFQ